MDTRLRRGRLVWLVWLLTGEVWQVAYERLRRFRGVPFHTVRNADGRLLSVFNAELYCDQSDAENRGRPIAAEYAAFQALWDLGGFGNGE